MPTGAPCIGWWRPRRRHNSAAKSHRPLSRSGFSRPPSKRACSGSRRGARWSGCWRRTTSGRWCSCSSRRPAPVAHVCDVYDALRTRRPYREAWSFAKTLGYLEERAGLEFDPELCAAFTRMMRQWEPQVRPPRPSRPLQNRNPVGYDCHDPCGDEHALGNRLGCDGWCGPGTGAVRRRGRPLARGRRQPLDHLGRRRVAGLRHDNRRRQTHDQWWGFGEARHAAPGWAANGPARYVVDSRSTRPESTRLVTYFSSLTAASLQPASFFSNRIAKRRRSTRGAPPGAGTYSNIACTFPVAVAPCTLKSSTVNFAVI